MIPDNQISVVPFPEIALPDGKKVSPQYLATLVLLARYWGKQDWQQLEWLLACLRGFLPIGDGKRPCDRCYKMHFLHPVLELNLCGGCIVDFVNSKVVKVEVTHV